MKKFLLFALSVLALSNVVSAQTKGDMYVGGILGVSVYSVGESSDMDTQTSFGLAPEVGYYIMDNLHIGGRLSYELGDANGNTAHLLTLGPKVGYNVRLADKLYYTPEVMVGFAYLTAGGSGSCGLALGLDVVAAEFKASQRCGISLSLVSLDYACLWEGGTAGSVVGFNFGLSPKVGFKVYF